MENEEVTRRLDIIISLLKLAHEETLKQVRARTLSDGVSAALINATATDFVGAGELKSKISKATKQSEKTVQRRIAELVEMGVLEKRATGQAAYRSTGVL